MYNEIRKIACAARVGDAAAINHVLDGLHSSYGDAVMFGRADADREMRRTAPLPQLDEPHEAEFARIDARRVAEVAAEQARQESIDAAAARSARPTDKKRRSKAA